MANDSPGLEPAIANAKSASALGDRSQQANSLLAGTPARGSLGAMLVEAGLISFEQLERARSIAHAESCRLGAVLAREGMASPRELAAIQALYLGIPMIELASQKVDADALSCLPEAIARRYTTLPLRLEGQELVVAMADPEDLGAIHDLTARARRPIRPVIATAAEIEEHIDLCYKATERLQAEMAVAPAESAGRISSRTVIEEPVVRALDLLLKQAVQDRASDIHIEPQESRLRIRFRIDGVLNDVMSLPLEMHPAFVSRVKIMSGMNIAERRRSQDGQFTFEAEGRKVDARVATSYTVTGEMVGLRILDKGFSVIDLEQIGMLPDSLEQYQKLLRLPYGMLLMSGPTGSGKTTALYASLQRMNRHERKIITIEDPVEYRFTDINQTQVNVQAGITFSSQLRAILRLDPDVILVGEIRDQETALIATHAAMTGHLVLSSIHANDAVGALYRLQELGVEPYLVCASVAGVTAQRLLRRVCPSCQAMVKRPAIEQTACRQELGEQREQFLYGLGCNLCAHTGYQGRTGVFEILPMTEAIREMFLTSAPYANLRAQAIKDGMVSMRRDGMLKVQQGITTPYEVMRAVFTL
ncbi:MAG: type II/IV secretion system protein [Chloroflexi bacterium]|nr:type II/IV secretion system protein [Chloroflexota bacterium]